MKIYLLIHEQDTDAAWGSDVKSFLRESDAQAAMRKEWEETVDACEYNMHEHNKFSNICDTMTVGELIKELQRYPADLQIILSLDDRNTIGGLTDLDISEEEVL